MCHKTLIKYKNQVSTKKYNQWKLENKMVYTPPIMHWAVLTKNNSDKDSLICELLEGKKTTYFSNLHGLKGALFSKLVLERLIDEEERHGVKVITGNTTQALISMSSGEQKKALLHYVLNSNPDFLILDNPFDNLDIESQKELRQQLISISVQIPMVQLMSRRGDILPFINNITNCGDSPSLKTNFESYSSVSEIVTTHFKGIIPPSPTPIVIETKVLVAFKQVSVSYDTKTIVKDINWKIESGEFWQLKGKNGSGKTTLLTMITGDNPKGYGKDLYLFGKKKGSGESVWDVKRKIGYFTPAMTDKFTGYHTVEYMLISGFFDSIGLYAKPTEVQLRIAKQWLLLINMWDIRNSLFHELTMGQKRLLMVTRAMIKHPLLLILDEPTAGLDDESAALFVALANKIAKETSTALVFVSHREEIGLNPQFIYELLPTEDGFIGKVSQNKKGG